MFMCNQFGDVYLFRHKVVRIVALKYSLRLELCYICLLFVEMCLSQAQTDGSVQKRQNRIISQTISFKDFHFEGSTCLSMPMIAVMYRYIRIYVRRYIVIHHNM